jgi:tRNA G18 (ribose-2'-O)-methylase SpoU
MRGTKESLNVSVAAGIVLYQLVRHWRDDLAGLVEEADLLV